LNKSYNFQKNYKSKKTKSSKKLKDINKPNKKVKISNITLNYKTHSKQNGSNCKTKNY